MAKSKKQIQHQVNFCLKDVKSISLAGEAELIDGSTIKSTFFKFLEEDLANYDDVMLTPKQARSLRVYVTRASYGVSAMMPLLCTGKKCSNKTCPFREEGNFPLGRPCIIEARMIQVLTHGYMTEFAIEPEHLSEMALVNKLVECDLMDYRANLGLAGGRDEEATSLLSITKVKNDRGEFETVNIHPLVEIKDKIAKTRNMILEAFVGTRKEKYKKAAMLKKTEDSDASNFLSDLKDMFSAPSASKSATSLDKIREDAEKVSKDLIVEADWSTDPLE
jgi:hypothetical protein